MRKTRLEKTIKKLIKKCLPKEYGKCPYKKEMCVCHLQLNRKSFCILERLKKELEE